MKATARISRAGSSSFPSFSGFTLVELLAVIVVAGLAAGLVTVSVARFQDKARFRASVRHLLGALRSARNEAIIDRTRCTFFVEELDRRDDEPGSRFRYGFDCDGGGKRGSWDLHEGYVIGGGPVAFFPKGYSSGGVIALQDEQEHRVRIGVDHVTGRARVGR